MSDVSVDIAPVCAICLTGMSPDEPTLSCPGCSATYHDECWNETGGCAAYGCPSAPPTDGLKPLEIPPAFWGREDKDCPNCGKSIMAMAVRCRHCGNESVARPESKEQHTRRRQRQARVPQLRRNAIILLVLSIFPIVAFIAAVPGALYFRANRAEVRKLSGGYEGLYRIAIATAFTQTLIIVLALATFYVRNL